MLPGILNRPLECSLTGRHKQLPTPGFPRRKYAVFAGLIALSTCLLLQGDHLVAVHSGSVISPASASRLEELGEYDGGPLRGYADISAAKPSPTVSPSVSTAADDENAVSASPGDSSSDQATAAAQTGADSADSEITQANEADNTGGSPASATVVGTLPSPLFNPNSTWYQRVDTPSAQLHSNSGGYTAELQRQVDNLWADVNITSYTPNVYVADANTPRYDVANTVENPSDPQWLEENWSAMFSDVPIPEGAVGSVGSDGEIIIYDPSTDTIWEMWKFAGSSEAGYSARWGASITEASQSDGVFDYPFSVSASGVSEAAGLITVADIQSGSIDHAIAIGVDSPAAGTHFYPANRDDGTSSSPNALPEGIRLRLDPNVDLSQYNLTPMQEMIWTAAQKYGFIVRDNTYSSTWDAGPVILYAENVETYGSDPYTAVDGTDHSTWMEGFPWNRVQALEEDFAAGN